MEYFQLKVLLFNFYPIWKCKKKLALHQIFFAIYLSLQRNQCFCGKKIKFLTSSKSRKHHRIHMIFYVGHPPLYVTFPARPPIRLSICSSVCPSVRLSICMSVRRAPYFRNRTSYDHYFLYTCVKWWYIQPFFSFFKNFDFLGH